MKSKATEVMEKILLYVSGIYTKRWLDKPGALIERLSTEDRLALSELKSEQLADVRDDEVFGSDQFYTNERISKEKMDFDKKMLKK